MQNYQFVNKDIKINILTRTSKRPNAFRKCYFSVNKQSYKNIRHIVSYDNKIDLSYLNGLQIDMVDVSEQNLTTSAAEKDDEGNLYAPYNLYCNTLLEEVTEGWIMFLDDDDHLLHHRVIESIVKQLQKNYSENNLYIWQMRYPNGRIKPTNVQIRNLTLKKNFVGAPCFLFHSKYKNHVKWDAYKAADYRFLKSLVAQIPNKIFLKKVLVQINNYGDLGRRNDLNIIETNGDGLPFLFNKTLLWNIIPKYHVKIFGRLVFHKKTYERFFNKFRNNLLKVRL